MLKFYNEFSVHLFCKSWIEMNYGEKTNDWDEKAMNKGDFSVSSNDMFMPCNVYTNLFH